MKIYNKKKNNPKSFIVIIILIIFIIGIIWLLNSKNDEVIMQNENTINKKPISLCFYRSQKTDSGLEDRAWLKLNILNNKVSGEFQNLPAEKDSKIGTFQGELGPLDPQIMGHRFIVWWEAQAEGMIVKEELLIEYGEGSATVGFGEMADRGDGVYVYKNKDNLFYINQMNDVDCDSFNEKLDVEKYIQENIKTIATNEAILGGTWYVISTEVNSSNNNGSVTYEDGHMQSKASFNYKYDKYTQEVDILNFKIVN